MKIGSPFPIRHRYSKILRKMQLSFILAAGVLAIVDQVFTGAPPGSQVGVASSIPPRNSMAKRIVGGEPASIRSHPWLASIQAYGLHICGGSILSTRVILTAAHCAIEYPLAKMSVLVGSSATDSGGSRHKVDEAQVHENLTVFRGHRVNDVALLKVRPPLRFGDEVRKIRLAEGGSFVPGGATASLVGWGSVAEDDERTPPLRAAELLVVDGEECAKALGDPSGDWMGSNGLMCAAAPGRDACQGDSGTTLVVDGVQVGIASWGIGCARPGYPGVYVNVSAYRGWIDTNLRKLERAPSRSAGFIERLGETYSRNTPIKVTF